MHQNENQEELDRCKAILLALFDLHIRTIHSHRKGVDDYMKGLDVPAWNPQDDPVIQLFEQYKRETVESYEKGLLKKLKRSLKGFTADIVNCGDVSFTKYIKETTGYDFPIAGIFEKRVAKIVKRGKIKNEDKHRDIVEIVEQLYQVEPVDRKRIDNLNDLLRDFDGLFKQNKNLEQHDAPPNEDDWFRKELSISNSPDNRRKLILFETGRDENDCYTQVMLEFGEMSGSDVYSVDQINLGIKTYWKDNRTIVIETKKEYHSSQRWEQVQFFQDVIQVEYVESE